MMDHKVSELNINLIVETPISSLIEAKVDHNLKIKTNKNL